VKISIDIPITEDEIGDHYPDGGCYAFLETFSKLISTFFIEHAVKCSRNFRDCGPINLELESTDSEGWTGFCYSTIEIQEKIMTWKGTPLDEQS